jgi:hypothetical protein
MPSISSCPACHRDITIPSGVALQRRLRCPLCDFRFLAEAVLAASTPAPPEVLLEDAVGEPSPLAAFGARLDEIVGGARFWNTSAEAPAPTAEFTLDGKTSEAPGMQAGAHAIDRGEIPETKSSDVPPDAVEAIQARMAAQAAAAAEVSAAGDAPQWDASRDELPSTVTKDHADDVRFTEGESADRDGAIANDDEISAQPGDELVDDPVGSYNIAAQPRPKPGGIGIFGQFVGMVGGGVIGLALGYYVLLCIGGARADFLDIRDKLPRWLVPRERGESPSNDDTSELPTRRPREARHDEQERLREIAAPSTQTPKSGQRIVLTGGTTDPAAPGFDDEREIGHAGPLTPSEHTPLGPTQFTAHTPDELAASLESVSGELGCVHCGGTGIVRRMPASGESADSKSANSDGQPGSSAAPKPAGRRARCGYCDGKPSGKLTLDLFDQLCDVAEIATFTRVEPTQPDWERLRNEAQVILFRIGNDHDKAQIAGRLAGPRLDDSRRLSNGIVLAGTVHDAGEEGSLYRTRLVLFGRPLTVTVMSLHAATPPLAAHDRVIMLGSIIDSPRDNLGGYVGSLPQVVWGGLALKLD